MTFCHLRCFHLDARNCRRSAVESKFFRFVWMPVPAASRLALSVSDLFLFVLCRDAVFVLKPLAAYVRGDFESKCSASRRVLLFFSIALYCSRLVTSILSLRSLLRRKSSVILVGDPLAVDSQSAQGGKYWSVWKQKKPLTDIKASAVLAFHWSLVIAMIIGIGINQSQSNRPMRLRRIIIQF